MTGPRRLFDLAAGWEFAPGRRSAAWYRTPTDDPVGHPGREGVAVDLPHCWNARDTLQEGITYRRGLGSYRRRLRLEELEVDGEESRWRLDVGPFWGRADVWFAGRHRGRFDGQSLGLWLSVDPPTGGCGLGLRLDNRHRRGLLPSRRDPDFLLYGGLCGGVRLWRVPAAHLRARRMDVRVEARPGQPARVTLLVPFVNESPVTRRLRVAARVWRPHSREGQPIGEIAGETVSLAAGAAASSRLVLEFEPTARWRPGRDNRSALHELEIELLDDRDELVDRTRRRLGFRHLEWGRFGLRVDGEPVRLIGCNRHESLPGLGAALPEEVQAADATRLRELGCNFVRLSHYPQSPAFLDRCDELGLLAWAEVSSWKSVGRRAWLAPARRQWRAMIERDRHRPCVAIWGMGNESRSRRAYMELGDEARRLDPTRVVGYAENHLYRARRQCTLGLSDVQGVNYELAALEGASAAARTGAVVVTECMNACLRDDAVRLEERRLRALLEEWEILRSEPFVAGHAIWCYADYATEYRRRKIREAGLLDAFRNARPGAWLQRARHGDEPFARAEIDWSVRAEESTGSRRRGRLYSTLPRVEIWLGETRERSVDLGDAAVVELDLEFRNAALLVRDPASGRALDRLEPWAEARTLRVSVVTPTSASADGEANRGLEPLESRELLVEAVDGEGRRCRSWAGTAVLRSNGPAQLACYNQAGEVELTRGRGRVWLRATSLALDPPRSTQIEVQATAIGLGAASLRLERRSPAVVPAERASVQGSMFRETRPRVAPRAPSVPLRPRSPGEGSRG